MGSHLKAFNKGSNVNLIYMCKTSLGCWLENKLKGPVKGKEQE